MFREREKVERDVQLAIMVLASKETQLYCQASALFVAVGSELTFTVTFS